MTAVEDRLRVTDPADWRRLADSWRRWAAWAGRTAGEFTALLSRLGATWSGAAATAAARQLDRLRHRLALFRLVCWQADQAISEFTAALERARALVSTNLAAALSVAGGADAACAERLGRLTTAAVPPGPYRPACSAPPAEVSHWWTGLTPAQRQWLLAAEPDVIGALDGVPAADRDAANRLLLDEQRAGDRLHLIADRLADDTGPRAYLLRLDLAGEGQAVVALGDPDRAANVLTHVPGMTAGLASLGGELTRAERVAVRAGETGPAAATSAVLWLGYDAPDFVHEAASARQAEAGAPALRRFQDGLRASHEGPPARQTVLGHSYGSLVVGTAAATPGLAADSVVFVGSPGVGVDSVSRLHVPGGEVWASTSRTDVIQYAALSPQSLLDKVTAPVPWLAFGRPGQDLWFGHNPAGPEFGARVFAAQSDAGHLGYWDRGRPALDTLAAITLGVATRP